MVVQTIDGISFQMKEAYDFSFISKYGKAFKIFDSSYSGTIGFGVEKAGKRYFLKFAGAKTWNATYPNTEDTIMRLKITVPKYKELKHPLLVNQVGAEEIGGGFMTVYDWFDGEDCGYMRPEMQEKLLALPNKEKLRIYEAILDFHAHVVECGYVAVDFNKGAIIYNFDNGNLALCDIDFYSRQYHLNGYSGIWGDPDFKSPEESRTGAVIDEVSNVYTMGAAAFYFFADNDKNSREKWILGNESYEGAKKAVNEQRSQRQQTIKELINDWKTAASTTN